MKKLVVKKNGNGDFAFEVDDPSLPGSPLVGKGPTMLHALGDWMIQHQASLGVFIDVDPSVFQDTRAEQAKYPDDGGLKDPVQTFEDASQIIKMVLKTFAK